MIAPGLYIRKEIESLAEELSGGPNELVLAREISGASEGSSFSSYVTVHLRELEDGWCHLTMSGKEEGTSLIMKFITGHEGIEDVLVWNSHEKRGEYGYNLFRKGKLKEQFRVEGPVLDAVAFVSNFRRVEARELIDALGFALRSIEGFGISTGKDPSHGKAITLHFNLPSRTPFWQRTAGSPSGSGPK